MKLGAITATLENLDGGSQPGIPISELEHAENATTLVESEAVMDSDYKEIDDVDTGISDAFEGMERLDEATDTVAAGSADDVTKTEVATVEALMSSIHYSLGMAYERATMESNASMSRRDLVLTMESKLEAIGKTLANGLKVIWEATKKFLNALFQNKEALKSYLQGVQSKLSGFNGQTGNANVAGFNSYDRCIEGLRTADTMMSIVEAAGQEYNTIVAQDHNEMEQASSKLIAQTLGKRTNDLLSKGTTLNGKGSEGAPLHGLCSNNRGIPEMSPESENPLPKIQAYAASTGADAGLSAQQAKDLINKSIMTLEKFSKLKRFENAFATAYKTVIDVVMAGYHAVRAAHGNRAATDAERDQSKKMNKRMLVTVFRGVAHFYGTMLPREVFNNISNVGKYVEACLKTTGSPEQAPAQ